MAKLQVYAGDGFAVTYDPDICAHVGECVRGLPEVFDSEAKPWVRPERATAERIAEVVARCPSGALQFVGKGVAVKKAPEPGRAAVQLRPNGPLLISGDFEVRAPDGTVLYAGQKTALCRCGQSGNKPFCDGTHKRTGFTG
ncbi:MAG TPA: (4Fe-4S)-binding protein [Anaeromyxobacteraceae bacterium]|nr:(4Fe-4S)-binding protein [Anaeromyxobacteraceae bacterium]